MFHFFKKLFSKEGRNDTTDYSLLNIHDLTEIYLVASAAKREAIRNSFNEDSSGNLLEQSHYLAAEAVRQQDYKLIKKGLILHSIENARYDFRDNIVRLSLLYHSAQKLKHDPDILFKEIANISDKNMNDLLLSFIKRTEANKSIASMGFKEITDPHFNYIDKHIL